MTEPAVDVAQAIAASLAAASLPRPIDPKFHFAPTWTRPQLAELRVSVVPSEATDEQASRADIAQERTIQIGLQESCQPSDDEKIADLLALAHAIRRHLETAGDMAGFYWSKNEQAPLYFPDHLREHSVFTAVIAATYKADRDLGPAEE